MNNKQIIVIGGGAAGFFGSIAATESNPEAHVTLLEKSSFPLTKVRISGGGRCNVTHNCMDPKLLSTHYPRGQRELIGPFNRFGPKDTIEWFESRGVKLKTESDGRMFPTTDDSGTVIACLQQTARENNIEIRVRTSAKSLRKNEEGQFEVYISDEEFLLADKVLLATGGFVNERLLGSLGHDIIEHVPSLFTFNIEDPRLKDLAGLSFPQAKITVPGTKLSAEGPLLITHWGLSGPAILKLSAWGARILHEKDYDFEINVNLIASHLPEAIKQALTDAKSALGPKQISKNPLFDIPKRFWASLTEYLQIPEDKQWSRVSNQENDNLIKELTNASYRAQGKSTNKDEFVTAGGINLKEVNFKTMESKVCPGLHFAGEVLDIDGITGGFNFQSAWTTGFIAGSSL